MCTELHSGEKEIKNSDPWLTDPGPTDNGHHSKLGDVPELMPHLPCQSILHDVPPIPAPRGKSGKLHQQQTTSKADETGRAREIRGSIHGEGMAAEFLDGKARLLKLAARKKKRAKPAKFREGIPVACVLQGLCKCSRILNKMLNGTFKDESLAILHGRLRRLASLGVCIRKSASKGTTAC